MAFIRNRKDAQEPQIINNPAGFDALYQAFLRFVEDMPSAKRKTWSVVSLIIATLLTVAASLPFPAIPSWVFVLIGFPAGLIVFANCVAFGHFTKIRDSRLFAYKENNPPSRRLKTTGIVAVVIITILIVIGGSLPYGLGGVVVITLALFGYNTIRRTPEEIELAKQGIPDPREYNEDDPEEEVEEVDEEFLEDDIEEEAPVQAFPNLRRPGAPENV